MDGLHNVMESMLNQMTFEEVNDRLVGMQDAFDSFSQTDQSTGSVMLDEDGIRASLSEILPTDAASSLLAYTRSTAGAGVMVGKENLVLPWALLQSPQGVATLGAPGLQLLGLDPSIPRDQLVVELGSQETLRTTMQNGMLEHLAQPEILDQIDYQLNVEGPFWQNFAAPSAPPPAPPPPGGSMEQRSLAVTVQQPLTNIVPTINRFFSELVAVSPPAQQQTTTTTTQPAEVPPIDLAGQVVTCLLGGQWSAFWWGFCVRISASCSTLLQICLTTAALPILITALKAAIAAAVATGATLAGIGAAAVAAAGGAVVLGLALYAVYIAAALRANTTPAGVSLCGTWATGPLWTKRV